MRVFVIKLEFLFWPKFTPLLSLLLLFSFEQKYRPFFSLSLFPCLWLSLSYKLNTDLKTHFLNIYINIYIFCSSFCTLNNKVFSLSPVCIFHEKANKSSSWGLSILKAKASSSIYVTNTQTPLLSLSIVKRTDFTKTKKESFRFFPSLQTPLSLSLSL